VTDALVGRSTDADGEAAAGAAPPDGSGSTAIRRRRPAWLRGTVLDLLVVALVVGTYRAVLLAFSHVSLFFHDSAPYLIHALEFRLVWDRPPGTSLFYKAVLWAWTDIRAVMLAQSLLGVGTALLVYAAARQLSLHRGVAVGTALVAGLAPSNLFFERLWLSESLSAFLTMAGVVLLLWCLRSPRWWGFALLGLVLAASTVVRLHGMVVLLATLCALLLFWRSAGWRRRGAAAALTFVVAAVPLYGLAVANAAAVTRDHPGEAAPALSYGDGFALFTKIAQELPCDDLRNDTRLVREVCRAGPEYRSNPDRMAWGPRAPVTNLRDRLGPPQANAVLKEEAVAAIRANPTAYLRTVWISLEEFWAVEDIEPTAFVSDPESSNLHPKLLHAIERAFGIPVGDYRPSAEHGPAWYDVHETWNSVRRIAWVGVVVAFVVALAPVSRRWPGRDGAAVLAAVLGATVLATAMTAGVIVPRYWYPFEAPAWVLTAVAATWLVSYVRARRAGGADRAGEPSGDASAQT
jgi:hypothetical protein